MILGSELYEKSNHFNGFWNEAKKLGVGDWVYYISDASKYSIKKSRIKEMHVTHAGRPSPLLGSCELLLENGDTVDYDDTFNFKEDALEYLILSLRSSIACHRQELATLQREIELEERELKRLEAKNELWQTNSNECQNTTDSTD